MHNFLVIIAFKEAEAAIILVVDLVVTMADNAHDPSHSLLAAPGKKHNGIGMLERMVLILVEKFPFIHPYGRKPVNIMAVYLPGKKNKGPELLPAPYLTEFKIHRLQ